MVVGNLSKRNGVQPDSARSSVLEALAEHGTLDAKQLDALSPYESQVWSRLAREMTVPNIRDLDSKCLVEKVFDKQTLKSAYALSEFGKEVLADVLAYSRDFRRRKATNHYHRAYAKLRRVLEDPKEPSRRWLAADITHVLELGASSFPEDIEQEPRQRYLKQVQPYVPVIAKLIEYQFAEISHAQSGDISGWCRVAAKYHETLKAENIESGFSKEFLRKLMIGRLS